MNQVPEFDVQELAQLRSQDPDLVVVDVRSQQAYDDWNIPGSRHVDALAGLRAGDATALLESGIPTDRPVVVVCNAGNASRIAVAALVANGYDAFSLTGGMTAWSSAWDALEVDAPGTDATVLQVRRLGKGCLSYVVASDGAAAVIDPSLPPQIYQQVATERGWNITAVLDTHVHADHVSRARALAEATSARLVVPGRERLRFDADDPAEGDQVVVGSSTLKVLATPGHTGESVTYLLDDVAAITGDTLFAEAVGRPDLVAADENAARARALALFESLQRLLDLADAVLVLPAHADVVPTSAPVVGSIGGARQLLGARDRDAFADALIANLPPTPVNHLVIVEINERGALSSELEDAQVLEVGANRCAVAV